MKISALVPIKTNNERLKNKHFLNLGNKPLISYLLDTLNNITTIDTYVYCSDVILKQYLPKNVKFLKRPKRLDNHKTKGMDIYQSFSKKVKADVYILAHATSPFISQKSIISGLEAVLYHGYDSAFSVKEIKTFCWHNNKPINYDLSNVIRTQDLNPIFMETSGFFIFKNEVLEKNKRIGCNPYMVKVNFMESIDIDYEEDFLIAQKFVHDFNLSKH